MADGVECFRMPAANGNRLEILRYGDVNVQHVGELDPKQCAENLETFEYKRGDIFVCTFPKCGTHWTANMIWRLKTLDESELYAMLVVEFTPSKAGDQSSPRLLLTHLRPNHLPTQHLKNDGKVILVLRNPKDVCVSFYYHLKSAALLSSGQTWNEFFESFINGDIPFGSYFEYLKEWDSILHDKDTGKNTMNVEVLYYEECKRNQKETLNRLTEYLLLDRDEEYIEKVIKLTSFAWMKNEDSKHKEKVNPNMRDEEGYSIIYRKGGVGDWKTHFTVAQSERMDALLKEKLQFGMINFEYCL